MKLAMSIPNPNAGNPFGEPTTPDWIEEFERSTDFWNRSPQLQFIAYTAAGIGVSPWGLLMGCQLHRLSHISPTVVLVQRDGTPDTIGGLVGGTSLNMFGCLTGESGDGKSVTFKKSTGMVLPAHTPISDGTGQGLVKSIAETEKVTSEDGQKLAEPYYITRFNRHSLVVHAPEIKTLNAEFAREASKTDSMMRSMWSGETVGMTTGDRDRRVTLPPNTYRVVGMWGVQPENASAILAGTEDGTPQRFLWMPTWEYRDPRALLASRVDPGQVTFPMPVFGQPGSNPFGVSGGELPTEYRDGDPLPDPVWVHWSPQMQTDVLALQNALRDIKRQRGGLYAPRNPEQEAKYAALTMRSHLTLTRIKLAAIMGFLHGRPNPTDLEWELAGIQLEVSTRELAGVWSRVNQVAQNEIILAGHQAGMKMHAAQQARAEMGDREYMALANAVYKHLVEHGPCSNREIRAAIGGGDSKRKALANVLRELEFESYHIRRDAYRDYWAVVNGRPFTTKPGEAFAEPAPPKDKKGA